MIILHVRQTFKTKEQLLSYYADLWEAGAPQGSRAEEGNLQYEYFFSAENDNQLLICECWKTQEDLDKHKQTPHFLALAPIKAKYDMTAEIESFETI